MLRHKCILITIIQAITLNFYTTENYLNDIKHPICWHVSSIQDSSVEGQTDSHRGIPTTLVHNNRGRIHTSYTVLIYRISVKLIWQATGKKHTCELHDENNLNSVCHIPNIQKRPDYTKHISVLL